MKLLVRIVLVVALIVQAGWSIVATRYSRAYREGIVAFRANRYADASAAFDAARADRESDSNIWTWAGDSALSRAEIAFAENDVETAREALDRAWTEYAGAVLRSPRDTWSWSGLAAVSMLRARIRDRTEGLNLAVLKQRAGGTLDADRAIALAAAELAVRLNPSGYVELDVLAGVHEANGDVEAARSLFVESARRMPAPSFHSWGGGRQLTDPLYRAVLEGLEAGIEKAPTSERCLLRYEIGRFAFSQGDPATALEQLNRALELAKSPYEVFQSSSEVAEVLRSEGRLAEARDALLRAKGTGYVPDLVSRRLGQVSVALGEFDRACAELRDALRASQSDTALRLQTSRSCESAGEIDLAERLLRDAFVLPNDNMLAARALLDFYRRVGREATAGWLARSWARDLPEEPELHDWASEFETGGF